MLKRLKNIDWTRTMFLVPILLVAGISISHVISWYSLANPYNWAIYLSIAIEVGAMTSLVATTKKIKGGVWFMFGLVTFIQVVGNIFYSYANIEDTDILFQKWIELTSPIFEMVGTDSTDIINHKRWLAFLEGGLLPLISLTSLHFYTKYDQGNDQVNDEDNEPIPTKPKEPESPKIIEEPNTSITTEEIIEEETVDVTPSDEEEDDKPLGKYDMKFGPEYTKMMDDLRSEYNDKGVSGDTKTIYSNVMDVDAKEEPEPEIVEDDDLPITEKQRNKHLKFRKRLLEKKIEEESKTVNEPEPPSENSRVEIIDGKKALIYPKGYVSRKGVKRDKINHKRRK